MRVKIDEQLPRIDEQGGISDARVKYINGLLRKNNPRAEMLILLKDFRDAKPVAKDRRGAIYFEVEDGTVVASKFEDRVFVYTIDNSKLPYFHSTALECLKLTDMHYIDRFSKGKLRPGERADDLAGFYLV